MEFQEQTNSMHGFDPRIIGGFGVGRFNALARQYVDVQGLPPRDVLSLPPSPIETPLNSFGLVDVKRTIEVVERHVATSHVWSPREKVHHLQYPAADYPNLPDEPVNPYIFRNIPTGLIALPEDCENLLHELLINPPVPEDVAMLEAIDAWRLTLTFYKAARNVVTQTRRSERRGALPITTETQMGHLAVGIHKKYKGVKRHLGALYSIPKELRLIEPTDSPEELAKSIAKVGQLAHKGYSRYELRRRSLSLVA